MHTWFRLMNPLHKRTTFRGRGLGSIVSNSQIRNLRLRKLLARYTLYHSRQHKADASIFSHWPGQHLLRRLKSWPGQHLAAQAHGAAHLLREGRSPGALSTPLEGGRERGNGRDDIARMTDERRPSQISCTFPLSENGIMSIACRSGMGERGKGEHTLPTVWDQHVLNRHRVWNAPR